MPRALLFPWLVFAIHSPLSASAERAAVPVSLKVEPFCAAQIEAPARPEQVSIACATASSRGGAGTDAQPAAFSKRTIRAGGETVTQIDF